MKPSEIHVRGTYVNARGDRRQVLDIVTIEGPGRVWVDYTQPSPSNLYGTCLLKSFARWAEREVHETAPPSVSMPSPGVHGSSAKEDSTETPSFLSDVSTYRMYLRQDVHCCADGLADEGGLQLDVHDGGAGPYLVISATEWALDLEQIPDLTAYLQEFLESYSKRQKHVERGAAR